MKKRDAVLSVAVLAAAVLTILYRQFYYEPARVDQVEVVVAEEQEVQIREISTLVTYEAPGKSDTVRFSVFVNAAGEIQDVNSVDVNDPNHQEKLDEFSATLTTMIKGKNLKELEAVDRVGKSSLTTDAFNSGIDALKAQV